MASSARIDEIKKKFDENPRRYFAPLANEFRKAGDLEQAIVICEEFLPQQAGHMSGHIVYGQALYESDRLPEARIVFETALGLDPENLIALRHLGDIARSEGELVDARRWYDRVLEADPRNDEIQGLIAALGGDASAAAAPAPTAPHASWMSDVATSAVETSDGPGSAAPELIDLALDDSQLHAPASSEVADVFAGRGVTPPPMPLLDAPFEAISFDGLQTTDADATMSGGRPDLTHAHADGFEAAEFEAPVRSTDRAEGLEPAEFEAPAVQTDRAEGLESTTHERIAPEATDGELFDLESSFELGAGSQASRAADIAPIDGLEESGATQPALDDVADLPLLPLDMDDGLALPPHGDALEHPASAPVGTSIAMGYSGGLSTENPRLDPPAAMEAMPALTLDDEPPMMELPPSVIAAESALMDLEHGYGASTDDDPTPDDRSDAGGAAPAPFVTETMAELYLTQGFRDEALVVFRQLSAASPSNERLRARVAETRCASSFFASPIAGRTSAERTPRRPRSTTLPRSTRCRRSPIPRPRRPRRRSPLPSRSSPRGEPRPAAAPSRCRPPSIAR
jgi:tetratricopeptide (TPR) repeat protein